MMRLYSGCGTRRLTSTTMVLAILVETTSPTFSFLNPCCATSCSAILFLRPRQLTLPQHRQNARPVFPHGAKLLQAFHLPHGLLKLKTKELVFHFRELVRKLFIVEV